MRVSVQPLRSRDLPKGPSQAPIRQIESYFKDPAGFMLNNYYRFGDIFTVRFPAMPPIVFVTNESHIKDVFANPSVYVGGQGNAAAHINEVLGDNSPLVQDGSEHDASGRMFRDIAPDLMPFSQLAEHLLMEAIGAQKANAAGFSFLHVVEQSILRSLVDCIFGNIESANQIVELVLALNNSVNRSSGWLTERVKLQKQLDELLVSLVTDNRRRLDQASPVMQKLVTAVGVNDQLLTSRALRDFIVTLLIAGHDSSATTIAWAFYHYLAEADKRGMLDDEHDPSRLNDWIRETQRLHNIVPGVYRMASRNTKLVDVYLPKGVIVSPAIFLYLRRSPQVINDRPDEFDPSRELDWINYQFGGGSHQCMGQALGRNTVMNCLRRAVSEYGSQLRLAGGYKAQTVRRGVTMAPSKGMPVAFR